MARHPERCGDLRLTGTARQFREDGKFCWRMRIHGPGKRKYREIPVLPVGVYHGVEHIHEPARDGGRSNVRIAVARLHWHPPSLPADSRIALFRREVKARALLRTDSPALRSHQKRNSSLRNACSPTIASRLRQMLRESSVYAPVTSAAMSSGA